jgi:hypothetical protein
MTVKKRSNKHESSVSTAPSSKDAANQIPSQEKLRELSEKYSKYVVALNWVM